MGNHLSAAQEQQDAGLYLDKIINVVENTMDGTSGAVYAIFLNALAHGLRMQGNGGSKHADAPVWAKAAGVALKSMGNYTPAKPGDRTLVEELNASNDVQKAAKAAMEGAKSTKGMKPQLGRTVYVGGSGYAEVPDPGAYGLSQFFS